MQFSTRREPKPTDIIGYMPGMIYHVEEKSFLIIAPTKPKSSGSFDLFHVGHIAALKEARGKCDYLVVGVHSDQVVNKNHGQNFPIMNLHERTLSVLSCRVCRRW